MYSYKSRSCCTIGFPGLAEHSPKTRSPNFPVVFCEKKKLLIAIEPQIVRGVVYTITLQISRCYRT